MATASPNRNAETQAGLELFNELAKLLLGAKGAGADQTRHIVEYVSDQLEQIGPMLAGTSAFDGVDAMRQLLGLQQRTAANAPHPAIAAANLHKAAR